MNNLWCTNYSSVRTNTRFTVIIDFREMGCFIATPCLFVSGREIPCLYVSEREIYDLLFTFAISAHGGKVQLTAYAQKPS